MSNSKLQYLLPSLGNTKAVRSSFKTGPSVGYRLVKYAAIWCGAYDPGISLFGVFNGDEAQKRPDGLHLPS